MEKRLVASAYAYIYYLVPDYLDKFIISFHFDMGNTTTDTAMAAGVSCKTIWERTKKIKKLLKTFKAEYLSSDLNG